MSSSFILTAPAARDLDAIFEYVLRQSGAARAMHVHARLYDAFSKAGIQPGLMGHIRDDLADESLRACAVFSFLIIYRPVTKPVQIIRVIHGARDLRALLGDE